jgi:hypothetical protein
MGQTTSLAGAGALKFVPVKVHSQRVVLQFPSEVMGPTSSPAAASSLRWA